MKDPFKGMTFSEPISFKEFVKSYDNYLDHQNRDKPITYDSVYLLNSSEKDF